MVDQGPRWRRRVAAAESANRLLSELSVDPTRRIDVFGLCEDLGLWLIFLPMDNLLGAFIPEGVGGIMITTSRPVSVQRFTAAHELGHWRMDHGHGLALDGAEHILGNTPVEREQLCQFFAANLLMPPPLVYGIVERMNVPDGKIAPEHVYAIAREAGTSYEAAARQLNNLDLIGRAELGEVLKPRPIKVKASLAMGRRPVNGYADVWPVNEHWNDQVLALHVEDEVVLSLPENRTTGYRWMVPGTHAVAGPEAPAPDFVRPEKPPDDGSALWALRNDMAKARATPTDPTAEGQGGMAEVSPRAMSADRMRLPSTEAVQVVGDEYLPSYGLAPASSARAQPARRRERRLELVRSGASTDSPRVGATGRRLIGLRFPVAGSSSIHLEYRSPFDGASASANYVVHALIEPRHSGFSVDQVALDSRDDWTGPVRQRALTRTPEPVVDDSAAEDEAEE